MLLQKSHLVANRTYDAVIVKISIHTHLFILQPNSARIKCAAVIFNWG